MRRKSLPQGWKRVALGEQAEIISSNVDKKSIPGEKAVRLCNYTDVYDRDHIDSDDGLMEDQQLRLRYESFRFGAATC